jgi:hypothetical protein
MKYQFQTIERPEDLSMDGSNVRLVLSPVRTSTGYRPGL